MNSFSSGNACTDSGKYLYAFLSFEIKEPIIGNTWWKYILYICFKGKYLGVDGSKIAIATDNNTIIVWNSNFSDSNLFLDGHDKKIIDFEFSNDGKKLATSSLDQSIKIWDTSNGRLLNSISIVKDWGTKIIFSNDVLIYGTYTGDVNFHILSNNN